MKWSVEDTHPNRAVLRILDQNNYPIAYIYTAPEDEDFQMEGIWANDTQRQANAKLMAAAPELLATLMLAKDMIIANNLDLPKTIGSIDAAIEKAIGGASCA